MPPRLVTKYKEHEEGMQGSHPVNAVDVVFDPLVGAQFIAPFIQRQFVPLRVPSAQENFAVMG